MYLGVSSNAGFRLNCAATGVLTAMAYGCGSGVGCKCVYKLAGRREKALGCKKLSRSLTCFTNDDVGIARNNEYECRYSDRVRESLFFRITVRAESRQAEKYKGFNPIGVKPFCT